MDNVIKIQPDAQRIVIEKARIAAEAVRARDEAIALLMAALSVPNDWHIAPDASAFVAPSDAE